MPICEPAAGGNTRVQSGCETRVYDESSLVLGIKARDEAALASMMERYSRPVYLAAFRILRQRPDAQEVTQDVFLALWRRPEQFNAERGRLGTWLLILSRSRALDLLRSRQLNLSLKAERIAGSRKAVSPSEARLMLEQLAGDLPREQAWVIRKVYIEGYTISEAADMCQTAIGTVKSRARLALAKLRSAADPNIAAR
jgi:RNA polymerase sigma-70 factor (ECF subfamily)